MQSNNTSNYQSPPISRLKQINKQQGQSSTLNIHPKTKYQKQQQVSAEEGEEEDEQEVSGEHEQQTASQWSMTDRLRLWRDDARAQHLYQTAAFWGSKVYNLTSNPNDAFWLAQVFFLTGQFYRAEKVLTSAKRINPKTLEPPTTEDISHTDDDDRHHHQDISQDFSFWDDLLPDHHDSSARIESSSSSSSSSVEPANTILVRMTDYSTACRYLAAQCMIRQGKWDAALEMVGEQNPFREHTQDPSTSNTDNLSTFNSFVTTDSSFVHSTTTTGAAMDGGIKFESSLCYLRGLIHLHHKALDRAKLSFLESLAIDVKCYESFEALVGGNMLEPEEEWEFIQSLSYHTQTPEDKLFIKSLYTVRLKKFEHKQEIFDSIKVLRNQFHLTDDPDTGFGLADWLYTNYRFIDCYRITSRILKLHYHHLPTLPLHLSSMTMIKKLLPSLFLLSHELIERDSSSPISWYGAGLWYFSQRRWEESRRFFSKAALLDSRFPEAWFAFGHALAYEGEHDQAITAYSTASHNFQGSHLPLLFIGMQHIQLANPTLAHDYLKAASEICAFDPLVIHERGVVFYYQEQWEESIKYFNQTIELVIKSQTDPVIWAPVYLNLSHCYRRLKRFKEALDSAQKAKSLIPRSASVLTALGMAYLGTGDNLSAIKYYHESLVVLPADPMTTCLLQFSLDLESLLSSSSTTTTKKTSAGLDDMNQDRGLGLVSNIVPRSIRENWNTDFEAFDRDLDGLYGNHLNPAELLDRIP
ncbi:hypothetical protein Pst134EA_028215 [Puccinia striiformis f. sp. tritici]|uniref:hypothetical protein n=1 Tax=Puccinia striiformis f. sp. tritici TaxID=168172 RepID=UPI00200726DD|nr:hypothetical protein Pst134EA_028215 [Puccinia striiformis f. sp. tritici]KAH9448926.1 hypothetical protein Pst134EA_028215 [Puccinia striiformis f. sp. tritici]KAI9627875.1 hypothetical protein KEM48_011950 [Puccinia striiformis f. sp. tritici PST-130]